MIGKDSLVDHELKRAEKSDRAGFPQRRTWGKACIPDLLAFKD